MKDANMNGSQERKKHLRYVPSARIHTGMYLEKKKHDAMEKWKKFEFGLKLLDLIFPKEEIIEEYDEEIEGIGERK